MSPLPPRLAMAGRRFGRLVVLGEAPDPRKGVYWRCACDCGGETVAYGGHLRAGSKTSCGCSVRTNNLRHGMSHSPEYAAWDNARSRCHREKDAKFPLYGGRGISMCGRWRESFDAFFADMGPRPSPKHSLDRFPNNDGNYEPGNCRWATASEQNQNRRPFKWSRNRAA